MADQRVSGGAEAEYVRRTRRTGPGARESFAVRNRSVHLRDVLARAATNDQADAQQLVGALRRTADQAASGRAAQARVSPDSGLALARVLVSQQLEECDSRDAATVFRAVLDDHGPDALGPQDWLLYAEALADLGRVADVGEVLSRHPVQRPRHHADLLRANAVNPFRADLGVSVLTEAVQEWLAVLNSTYRSAGLEEITLAPGTTPVIDRLIAAPATLSGGPTVTVVVPPTAHLDTALASLHHQSWQDLEIIVVHPAGQDERVLRRWQARDDRIVSVAASSRGSRNEALARAQGDLITVHLGWCHPRRIEMQARRLAAHPELAAVRVRGAWVSPDLRFHHVGADPILLPPDPASAMYRRELLMEQLGGWDTVEDLADEELNARFEAHTDGPLPVIGAGLMTLRRVPARAITDGRVARGSTDGGRTWYLEASRAWHREAKDRPEGLRLDAGRWSAHPESRPFAAPVATHTTDPTTTHSADVVYATDFRFPGGNSHVTANEVSVLLDHGLRVALLHLDSPVLPARQPLYPRVVQLSRHPGCSVISTRDDVSAPLTIVRHPTVLQYPYPQRTGVQTGAVLVVVNHAPFTRDGAGAVYDVPEVLANGRVLFGRDPVLVPESAVIAAELTPLTPSGTTMTGPWPGTVLRVATEPRRAEPGRRPVIGRHGRDHPLKWPADPADLAAVYPLNGSVDVRVLGGADSALEVLGLQDVPWTVHAFGSRDPWEFLSELDFWLYAHHPDLVESFGMSTAEAMAAGLVVVVPPYMEPNFGTGARYAPPSRMQDVVRQLWTSPEEYQAQSRAAIDYARTHFGPEALMTRVGAYLARR